MRQRGVQAPLPHWAPLPARRQVPRRCLPRTACRAAAEDEDEAFDADFAAALNEVWCSLGPSRQEALPRCLRLW